MITRPSKPSARNVAAAVALASPPPNSMKRAFLKRVSSLSTPSGRRRRTDRAGDAESSWELTRCRDVPLSLGYLLNLVAGQAPWLLRDARRKFPFGSVF